MNFNGGGWGMDALPSYKTIGEDARTQKASLAVAGGRGNGSVVRALQQQRGRRKVE